MKLASELNLNMFHNGTVFPPLMEPQPQGLGEGSRLGATHAYSWLARRDWDDPTRLARF
jgi:hypothetical protein